MNAMASEPAAFEPPRITHAMEDYLKAIHRLGGDGQPVTIQRLSDELALSGSSVANMVKRLHELGLVNHARYGDVALTAAGERSPCASSATTGCWSCT